MFSVIAVLTNIIIKSAGSYYVFPSNSLTVTGIFSIFPSLYILSAYGSFLTYSSNTGHASKNVTS